MAHDRRRRRNRAHDVRLCRLERRGRAGALDSTRDRFGCGDYAGPGPLHLFSTFEPLCSARPGARAFDDGGRRESAYDRNSIGDRSSVASFSSGRIACTSRRHAARSSTSSAGRGPRVKQELHRPSGARELTTQHPALRHFEVSTRWRNVKSRSAATPRRPHSPGRAPIAPHHRFVSYCHR